MLHPARVLLVVAAAFGISLAARTLPAAPQETAAAPQQAVPTPQERVAALKQSLQESQAQIRRYEWIETTIMSLKGEEKSRSQKRCYYGADGKLQKVPIGQAAPKEEAPSGGRRGGRVKKQIVENKKDEMKDYMERAAGLVHQYVPPKPEDIQRAKDAGKVQMGAPAPGHALLEISDYIQPGDRLSFDLDAAAGRLLGLSIASYLDKPEDAVALKVQFGALTDGASYAAETTLDAKAKNIRVVIQNTGYRPLEK